MRYIIPLILIAIAVTGFLMFTKPLYEDITALRAEVGSSNNRISGSVANARAILMHSKKNETN